MKDVKKCSSCGNRRSKRNFYFLTLVVIVILCFIGFGPRHKDNEKETNLAPQSQTDFSNIVDQARKNFARSPNTLKSGEIIRQRDHALSEFRTVVDWTGVVKGVQQMRGKGAISIEFSGVQVVAGVHMMLGLDTLIPESRRELYQSLLVLSAGDKIQFSGDFTLHRSRLVELSYTERSSAVTPEFLFTFSRIEKIN